MSENIENFTVIKYIVCPFSIDQTLKLETVLYNKTVSVPPIGVCRILLYMYYIKELIFRKKLQNIKICV